jgi:hypothetical protein
MPTQGCLDNIKNKNPPRYCSGDYCSQIQGDINEYCHHNGLGGDVPVPQIDSQGKCWCCCSCMAWGTPVEVSAGNYQLVETILPGQMVIATGGKMAGWERYEVTEAGGIAPGTMLDICYFSDFTLASDEKRHLITTADHLFLLPDGKLKPIQDLRPGDTVVEADGGHAIVSFVATGQFSGGVRNFALGPFDPKANPDDPYKGHLINTFGLVTADLAVQMAYYELEFGDHLVAAEAPAPIGSRAFFEAHDTRAYEAFHNDREQWPAGFTAAAPSLFNIPPSALAYFTDDQARALGETEAVTSLGDSQAMANFKYLRQLFVGFYKDIYYAVDWADHDVNAWYFNSLNQPYIVISGGMLRFPDLGIPGLSMVLCHMIANKAGYGCQGEADFQGSATMFRTIWFDELYFEQIEPALAQIHATFAKVPPQYAGENPDNICRQPSLECREQAIKNGLSFAGVPACALPSPSFALTGATAPDLDQVEVTFSTALFAPTATDPANYTIEEEVVVLQASYVAGETKVTLATQPMLSATDYVVRAKGVLSARGQSLSPQHDSAAFRTV